jgi:hypothetical protein
VKREFDRAFDSYIKGIATEEETRPRLAALREERKALEEELMAMQPPTNVVTLHPGAVKCYLESWTTLQHRSRDEQSLAMRELPRRCGNSFRA